MRDSIAFIKKQFFERCSDPTACYLFEQYGEAMMSLGYHTATEIYRGMQQAEAPQVEDSAFINGGNVERLHKK